MLREFLAEAARTLDDPVLAALPAQSWRIVLELIDQRWRGPEKLVIALDEFQWSAGASEELPSVLSDPGVRSRS